MQRANIDLREKRFGTYGHSFVALSGVSIPSSITHGTRGRARESRLSRIDVSNGTEIPRRDSKKTNYRFTERDSYRTYEWEERAIDDSARMCSSSCVDRRLERGSWRTVMFTGPEGDVEGEGKAERWTIIKR